MHSYLRTLRRWGQKAARSGVLRDSNRSGCNSLARISFKIAHRLKPNLKSSQSTRGNAKQETSVEIMNISNILQAAYETAELDDILGALRGQAARNMVVDHHFLKHLNTASLRKSEVTIILQQYWFPIHYFTEFLPN